MTVKMSGSESGKQFKITKEWLDWAEDNYRKNVHNFTPDTKMKITVEVYEELMRLARIALKESQ